MPRKTCRKLSRKSKRNRNLSNCKPESSSSQPENTLPSNGKKLLIVLTWRESTLPSKSRETTQLNLTPLFLSRIKFRQSPSRKSLKLTRLTRHRPLSSKKREMWTLSVLRWSICSSRSTKHPSTDSVCLNPTSVRIQFHNFISSLYSRDSVKIVT